MPGGGHRQMGSSGGWCRQAAEKRTAQHSTAQASVCRLVGARITLSLCIAGSVRDAARPPTRRGPWLWAGPPLAPVLDSRLVGGQWASMAVPSNTPGGPVVPTSNPLPHAHAHAHPHSFTRSLSLSLSALGLSKGAQGCGRSGGCGARARSGVLAKENRLAAPLLRMPCRLPSAPHASGSCVVRARRRLHKTKRS